MRNERAPVRALALVALTLLTGSIAGCSDESADPAARQQNSAGANAPHKVKWLELSSAITPAQWLVSRDGDKVKTLDDPEVRRVTETLASANDTYRESERMIANRAVQLSDMLGSLGFEETPVAILDDLTSVAGEIGQTEGFGALSQHYFNLRVANVERGEALATLKTRYGRRSATSRP